MTGIPCIGAAGASGPPVIWGEVDVTGPTVIWGGRQQTGMPRGPFYLGGLV